VWFLIISEDRSTAFTQFIINLTETMELNNLIQRNILNLVLKFSLLFTKLHYVNMDTLFTSKATTEMSWFTFWRACKLRITKYDLIQEITLPLLVQYLTVYCVGNEQKFDRILLYLVAEAIIPLKICAIA